MISIKSKREIEIMKQSCQLAADTLDYLEKRVSAGVTTEELNSVGHDYILSHGAYPSPLNYHGFPKSICTSKNQIICHGIPSKKDMIKSGDIINVDITTYFKKFHGDTNRTFLVGEVEKEVEDFVRAAYFAMRQGIDQVRPGAKLGDIGAAIETYVHDHGYSVVHEYCGHGIGRDFHEEPQVLHYGSGGTGVELRPGMTFTVEPMINMGKRHCRLLKDNWTVVTSDGSRSAQFEHTLVVTEEGYEIMTFGEKERETGSIY